MLYTLYTPQPPHPDPAEAHGVEGPRREGYLGYLFGDLAGSGEVMRGAQKATLTAAPREL